MKAFLRSDGVQAVLGWLLGAYLRVVLRTVRWRHENLACVEPVLADDEAKGPLSGVLAGMDWAAGLGARAMICLVTQRY